jgi:hypothetical protein
MYMRKRVSVAFGIQREPRLRHIVNCSLPDCTIFFYIVINCTI